MNRFSRYMMATIAVIGGLSGGCALAQNITAFGGAYEYPAGVTADASGNLFVVDAGNNIVEQLSPSDGYFTPAVLAPSLGPFRAVATDRSGNVFIASEYGGVVFEALAAGGYSTVKMISAGLFSAPAGIAVDGNENLFVADQEAEVVYELSAASGYATVRVVAQGFGDLQSIAADSAGDVFVNDLGKPVVYEIVAVDGSIPTVPVVKSLGSFTYADAIALDANGNLFVSDVDTAVSSGTPSVKELTAASGYTTVTTYQLGVGLQAFAIDGQGNLFTTDLFSVTEIYAAGGYKTFKTLDGNFSFPRSLTVDGAGDVFVADYSKSVVDEMVAAGGYATVSTVLSGLEEPAGIAVDRQGNVFVSDVKQNVVREILAAGGHTTVQTVGSGFNSPVGIALDAAGNLFVADAGSASVKEVMAAGGYQTVKVLAGKYVEPVGVALDAAGDVFVADVGGSEGLPNLGDFQEILASGGYATTRTLTVTPNLPTFSLALDQQGDLFFVDRILGLQEVPVGDDYSTINPIYTGPYYGANGVALDKNGNIYFTTASSDAGVGTVQEIVAGQLPIVSAVLPTAQAVQVGGTTTFFATMINAGPVALNNCRIALPFLDAYQVTLTYQTTDSLTNGLSGTPNTPVSLAAGGTQSFVVALQNSSSPLFQRVFQRIELLFGCDDAPPAASVTGVNTFDLSIFSSPPADIIVLAATPTNDGILTIPDEGAAAFAIASTNIGVTNTLTVSVDTGTATLPLTATICETNPADGQCQAAPATTVSLSYSAGAAPTFSVFLQATGAIPFAPGASRVFVRFEDASGDEYGATSVAVRTQ